jgi:cation:H+ antiporter
LRTTDHDNLGVLSQVMLLFVIPITVITLLVILVRSWPKKSVGGDGT